MGSRVIPRPRDGLLLARGHTAYSSPRSNCPPPLSGKWDLKATHPPPNGPLDLAFFLQVFKICLVISTWSGPVPISLSSFLVWREPITHLLEAGGALIRFPSFPSARASILPQPLAHGDGLRLFLCEVGTQADLPLLGPGMCSTLGSPHLCPVPLPRRSSCLSWTYHQPSPPHSALPDNSGSPLKPPTRGTPLYPTSSLSMRSSPLPSLMRMSAQLPALHASSAAPTPSNTMSALVLPT